MSVPPMSLAGTDRRTHMALPEVVSREWLAASQACDTSLAHVSRAPIAKIEDYKHRPGWTFPFRGTETIGGSYYMLDETALGRQEAWEDPNGRAVDARGNRPDFSS